MQRMRTVFINNSNEWRTGWRIVAMFVLLAAAMTLINVGWRAAGLPGQRTSTPWQFLGFGALISGTILAVIVFLLRYFEKRGTDAIWLPFDKSALRFTAIGTALGAIPICLILGLAMLVGYGTIAPGTLTVAGLATALLPTLLAAFLFAGWEELVLRGYLLRQLSLGFNPLAAVIITGVVFGLLHSGNPGANWQGLLYTAIGGMLMALLVFRYGSLWLMVGYHFGWNATASGIFGLELSGLDEKVSVFASTLSGSDWLTGGDYGFEASLPAVVIELLVLSLVLFTSRNLGLRSVP